jgi:predicted metal-dependent hydrolase
VGRVFERIDNDYVEDIEFGAWPRADEELRNGYRTSLIIKLETMRKR